jgi:hypothetical protein
LDEIVELRGLKDLPDDDVFQRLRVEPLERMIDDGLHDRVYAPRLAGGLRRQRRKQDLAS